MLIKNYLYLQREKQMVDVAQLVRVSDCGSEGRGFDPRLPPRKVSILYSPFFYIFLLVYADRPILLLSLSGFNKNFKL